MFLCGFSILCCGCVGGGGPGGKLMSRKFKETGMSLLHIIASFSITGFSSNHIVMFSYGEGAGCKGGQISVII